MFLARYSRTIWLLASAAAIVAGALYLVRFVKGDPFANFKRPDQLGDIGIRLDSVKLKHYSEDKLKGIADIDRIDVRNDRQFLDFTGVKNGHVETPKGDLAFTAQEANFNVLTHQMNVTAAANVKTKDLSVVTAAFMYDESTSQLNMPGLAQGQLFGGKLDASGLVYNAKDDSYEISSVKWVGTMPKSNAAEFGVQDTTTLKPWTIAGHVKSYSNADPKYAGIDVYTDASATDGEVLVKAPRIERVRKTDVLTCTGKVFYFGEKANLVCDKAVIYRKEKRAVLSGNVHMLVKPKDEAKLKVEDIPPFQLPSAAADPKVHEAAVVETQEQKDLDEEARSSKTVRKYPAHLRADQIEYWYGKGSRHAIITGKPLAYQELPGSRWRSVAAHEGFYDGEKDTLKLVSSEGKQDARMVDWLGDDVTATWFVINTKDDDEENQEWEAENMHGTVYSEEETGKSSSTPAKTPPTTTPPAPNTTPAKTPVQQPPPTPPVTPPAKTTGGGGAKP